MAASIYRTSSSPTRFQQFAAGPTHYTTSVNPTMHLRYNSFAIDGHQVPLPSTPPTRGGSMMGGTPPSGNNNNSNGMSLATPPPGATLGLLSGSSVGKPLYMHQQQQQQQQYHHQAQTQRHSSPIYSSAPSPLFISPMLAKSYHQHMERQMSMGHSSEPLLMVSPGMPTPLELSIYEIKQPTGFLHVTAGNQTVEFLDGVANMPRKR